MGPTSSHQERIHQLLAFFSTNVHLCKHGSLAWRPPIQINDFLNKHRKGVIMDLFQSMMTQTVMHRSYIYLEVYF